MTLLVQTESRIQQRKERRRNARGELFSDEVRAALDIAKGEVDRMQAPLINIGSAIHTGTHRPQPGHGATARLPLGIPASIQPPGAGLPVSQAAAAAAVAVAAAAAGDTSLISSPVISDEHISGAVELASKQLHKYYREEFENVLNALGGRLKYHLEQKDEEDLVPDGVMERLRRLVPSEIFVAWAAWTASLRMVDESESIPTSIHYIVWVIYGVASFFYVLINLMKARWDEEVIDVRAPPGSEGLRGTAAGTSNGTATSTSRPLSLAEAVRTQKLPTEQSLQPLPSLSRRYVPRTHSMPGPHRAAAPAMPRHESAPPAGHGTAGAHGEHLPALDETGEFVTEITRKGALWRNLSHVEGSAEERVPMARDHDTGTAAGAIRKPRVKFAEQEPPRRREPLYGSPSNLWLVLQAVASMCAFLLMAAATGDVYAENWPLMLTLAAAAPLFGLFAQFLVPNTGRRGGPVTR